MKLSLPLSTPPLLHLFFAPLSTSRWRWGQRVAALRRRRWWASAAARSPLRAPLLPASTPCPPATVTCLSLCPLLPSPAPSTLPPLAVPLYCPPPPAAPPPARHSPPRHQLITSSPLLAVPSNLSHLKSSLPSPYSLPESPPVSDTEMEEPSTTKPFLKPKEPDTNKDVGWTGLPKLPLPPLPAQVCKHT